MANFVVTSVRTSAIALGADDIVYIGPAGLMLVLNASAITGGSTVDTFALNVDGTLTALGGRALHLTNATSAVVRITVGAQGTIGATSAPGTLMPAIEVRALSMVLVNAGTIQSQSQEAVRLVGSFSITNTGQILGTVDVDGNGRLSNLGTITAAVNKYAVDIFGSASVVNSGTILGTVFLDGALGALQNSGRIAGSVFMAGQGSALDFVNSGRIEPHVASGIFAAVSFSGFSRLEVSNTGTISSGATGIEVSGFDVVSGTVVVQNSGTVTGHAPGFMSTEAGLRVGAGLTLVMHLASSGTFASTGTGVWLDQARSFVTNLDGGVIAGTGGPGLATLARIDLVNHGTIATAGEGAAAVIIGADGGRSTVVNHGTITAVFGNAFDTTAIDSGAGVSLTNHGTLEGAVSLGDTGDFVTNTGGMGSLFGAAGNDRLVNRGEAEGFVLMGDGEDAVYSALGRIFGQVDLGRGDDTLVGGSSDDDVRGGLGNDTIMGGAGNDALQGDAGNDTLRGGEGDDTLTGGAGQDGHTGGAGADVFVFAAAADIVTGTARDWITDFTPGVDRIDLSAVMAGAAYVAAAAFAGGGAVQIRYVAATGLLQGDANGDGAADWSLVLTSRPAALTGADFLL